MAELNDVIENELSRYLQPSTAREIRRRILAALAVEGWELIRVKRNGPEIIFEFPDGIAAIMEDKPDG